jgi:hypothetical protein
MAESGGIRPPLETGVFKKLGNVSVPTDIDRALLGAPALFNHQANEGFVIIDETVKILLKSFSILLALNFIRGPHEEANKRKDVVVSLCKAALISSFGEKAFIVDLN